MSKIAPNKPIDELSGIEANNSKPKKRKFLITNSFIPKDFFRKEQKRKFVNLGFKIRESEYLKIIKVVDQLLADELINGNVVELPLRMGKVSLYKKAAKSFILKKDGSEVATSNRGIDWKSTLELAKDDEEFRNSGIKIRNNNKYVIKVIYDKKRAEYKNKTVYNFRINRSIFQRVHINESMGNELIFAK